MIVWYFFPNALNGFPETRVELAGLEPGCAEPQISVGRVEVEGASDEMADETERKKLKTQRVL